jgi:hypothetical protein
MERKLPPALLLFLLLLVAGVDRSWAQPTAPRVSTTSIIAVLKVEVRAIIKIVVVEDSVDEQGLPIAYVISNLGKELLLADGRLTPELRLITVEEWHRSRGKGGDGDPGPEVLLVARYSATPP